MKSFWLKRSRIKASFHGKLQTDVWSRQKRGCGGLTQDQIVNLGFITPEVQQKSVSTGARPYLGEGISRGQQHILWFQVTVNDVFKVQVPQRNQNL